MARRGTWLATSPVVSLRVDRPWPRARVLALLVAGPLLALVYAAVWLAGRWRRRRLFSPFAIRRALRRLGLRVRGRLDVVPLGGGHSNAVAAVAARSRRERFVIKQSLPLGTLLAHGARRLGPMPYAEAVSGRDRLRRELTALTRLRAAGVRVPAVVAADPDRGLLLLEYVDGRPLLACAGDPDWMSHVAAFGRALAAAHRAGIVLTDCHPGNAMVTADGRIALLDLEFAELRAQVGDQFEARRAFDLAYAAGFFEPAERDLFLRAAGAGIAPGELAVAAADLEPYAPLVALERWRQRRAR